MFTKPFQQLSKHDANIAGGKGASLGEMITSGIPVPDGFVVLSTTFDKFLEITDISIEIDAILNKVDHNEVHTVENASKQIQALILSAKMPKDIAKEIKTEFNKLNCKYVAVRSSATAEDSASAAWAGQLDSFLNTTEETLLENVQRCFASLFTPRAIFYRFEKELHNQTISVAVVVQRMVNSKVSGIAFSVHPVTEDRNQIIIEAGFGLGEAIVSGQITPDSYVVTKDNLNIIDKNVYTQERGIFRDDKKGGNEWRNIPEATAKEQCLSDKQIIELSNLIIKIENHYNFPCDIEWAMEDDIFYIVQSRPITTLSIKLKEKSKKYTIIANDFQSPLIRNEIWVILTTFWKEWYEISIPSVGIFSNENSIDYFVDIKEWINTKEEFQEKINKNPLILKEVINFSVSMGEEMNKFTSQLLDADIINWTSNQMIEFYRKFCYFQSREYAIGVLLPLIDIHGVSFLESFLKDYLSKNLPKKIQDEAYTIFTSPIENSFAMNQEMDLLSLADYFFQSDECKSIFLKNEPKDIPGKLKQLNPIYYNKLKEHAEKHGWVYYVYMGPTFGFVQFAEFLKDILDKGIDPQFERNRKIKERKNLIQKRKEYLKKLNPSKNDRILIELVSAYVFTKPRRKDYQSRSYYHLEKFYAEFARRLNITLELARSSAQEQVYGALLTGEINKEKIKEQYGKHLCYLSGNKVVVLSGDNAQNFMDSHVAKEKFEIENSNLIMGNTAFPGKAKGIVKVINDHSTMGKMEPGNILVSVATTPNIVQAMKKASAIITDEGGLTCHAAIVSRELEVPCVVGTKFATKVLKDGDEVEVDADNGVVRILKKADEISTDTREASNINFLNKKELLNFLMNNEFDVQSAKASFFMCDLVFSIYARFIKTNIGDFPVLSYLDSNNQFREIISKNDILKIGEYLYSRFEKGGIAEIKKMIINQIEIEESLDSFKNQKGIDIKVYSDFINKFKKWWEYALLLEDKGQFSYQKIEDLLLKRLGEEKTKKIMGDIFCSSNISVFSEERIHFYNICLRVFKNSEIKEKILKNKPRDLENSLLKKWYQEYNEKYFYFKTDFYERKEITFNDFINDLKNEIISGDASAISNKIKAVKKEFVIMKNKMKLARLELNKEELEVSDYINQLINWSDRRKIGMMKTLYYLLGFLKEISVGKKIEYGELILCSSDEVFYLLETGSLPKSKIRGDLFGCYYGDDSKLFFGDEALEVFGLVNFETKNIVGQVASRGGGGVFRGVVRVINDPFRQKFNKDDILVTTMTRIDFVPIMGIAKAIITDEGGVTSHAAIVSRELGVPCIIGTKIATQLLKDGDEVEIDMDKGIVKILRGRDESSVEVKEDIDIKEFKESIKDREYITQQGNISIALLGNICNSIQEKYISTYGYKHIRPILTLQKGSHGVCYFDLEMYRDFSRISYSRIKDSIYDLPEYQDYIKLSKIINREYKNFSIPQELGELKSKIVYYFDLVKKYLVTTLFCEAVDHQVVKELAKKLKVKDIDKFVEITSLPTRPSFVNHQNQLFLEGKDISWSFTTYFSAPNNIDREKLLNKKRKDFSKKEVEEEIKRNKLVAKENQKLVDNLMKKSSVGQRRAIEFVQASINIRDNRKEFILKMFTILSDSLRSLAKKYDISYEMISTMADNEIDRLDNPTFIRDLRDRFEKGVAMISYSNKSSIGLVDYELAKNTIFDQSERKSSIDGICANKGLYTGSVRIIISEKDFHQFQEGEILVTGMTRAEYVPLMRKAGAIITDEGGVTCHAAIISRELGKPCIIGTKVATQVLKDGDKVEVDAENGVVRILNKNSNEIKINYDEWKFEFRQRDFQPILMADQWSKSLYKYFSKEAGLDVPHFDCVFGGDSRGYNKIEQKTKFIGKFLKACEDDKYLQFLFKKILKRVNEIDKLTLEISRKKHKNKKEILMDWKIFNELFLQIIPWFYYPYYISEENFLTNKVKKGLLKYKKEIEKITDINNALLILSYPSKDNKLQEEQNDLYQIVKFVLENKNYKTSSKLRKMTDSYLDKYSWMTTFIELPLELSNKSDLNKKINDSIKNNFLKEFEIREERKIENHKLEERILKIIKENKSLIKDIKNAKYLGWILSASVEDLFLALSRLIPFYKKIAKNIGVKYSDWIYFTADEIEDMLLRKKIEYDLIARKKSYFYIMENGKRDMIFGEEAQKRTEEIDKKLNSISNDIKEITGTPVYPGVVEGLAHICFTPDESKKLKEGEILVCGMTSPDYVPAMKKSKAVVTDEGGVLCHAAIISRELGKTCVVGTKMSTKAIKTGDKIIVDGDRGLVILLNNKK
jgi:rifampicin phosphotransferase